MVTVNRGSKCRIYPNKTQQQFIDDTLNYCRYIYNHMLDRNNKIYKRRGEHLSYIAMQNLLPSMKKYQPWLKDADSQALKYACRQVDTAFKKFFKHEAGYPKFHSKKGRQSYTTTNSSAIHINDDRRKIKIPCLGCVKVKGLYIPENFTINYATISKEPDGSYFISINYRYEIPNTMLVTQDTFNILGLDYKSDGLYVDSDGKCADMPHWFCESQAKLARQQRILSRRKGSRKGETKSHGWHKQYKRVARIQRKAANQRNDHLHKLSRTLAKSYDAIAVEDLNMKAISNKGFSNGKATMDNGYGIFIKMLDYKLSVNGKQLIKVDRWYPSSQICHICGYKESKVKDIHIRKWTCPICGSVHDRDHNSAINIKNEGLRILIQAKSSVA